MNYRTYSIKGRHLETNRLRTLKLEAFSEDDATIKAQENGLEKIESIKFVPEDVPSESQLKYLKGLGIPVPNGITSKDASALLTRHEEEDLSAPSQGLIDFATEMHIKTSLYVGENMLYQNIFKSLDNRDKIAFFIFSVYRYISGDQEANMNNLKQRAFFYGFADMTKNNKSFMNSFNRYQGKDLISFDGPGSSTDTIAFKEARQFLTERGIIK